MDIQEATPILQTFEIRSRLKALSESVKSDLGASLTITTIFGVAQRRVVVIVPTNSSAAER